MTTETGLVLCANLTFLEFLPDSNSTGIESRIVRLNSKKQIVCAEAHTYQETVTRDRLLQLLDPDFDKGILIWKERPLSEFKNLHDQTRWNNKHTGKLAGGIGSQGYVEVAIESRKHKVHRLIFLLKHGWLPKAIDHINGVRDDNRIVNLRAANPITNHQNQKLYASNKSGRVGVWMRGHKWQAQIRVNRRMIHLGSFQTFDKACAARAAAEIKHGFHPNHGRRL